MAISEESIIDVTPKPMHAAEAIFLPAIAKGLGTTFRHLFGNITKPGKNKDNIYVVQYPEEKRDDRPVVEGGQERSTFRGVHRLNKDEDDRVHLARDGLLLDLCEGNGVARFVRAGRLGEAVGAELQLS